MFWFDLIDEGKDVIINNNEKIVDAGKEWIKFLTIPLWCDRDLNDSKNYIIPLYTRKNFFCNKNIKKALDELVIFFSSYYIQNLNEIYSREKRIKYAKLRAKIDKYKILLKENNIDYEENEDEDDIDENSEQNKKIRFIMKIIVKRMMIIKKKRIFKMMILLMTMKIMKIIAKVMKMKKATIQITEKKIK